MTPDCANILQEKIPLYHGWTDDSPAPPAIEEPISRAQLLDSTPVSDAEFSIAWDALLAFETNDGTACRPSAATIIKTVSEISTAATAESFSLSPPSGFTVSAILGMLDDIEIPAGLVMAVIRSMCDRVAESMDDDA